MPKKLLNMFPRRVKDRLWVYLVGYQDGTLKVGLTSHPRQRMSCHRLAGAMEWCHLLGCGGYGFGHSSERMAIQALSKFGSRQGRTELFSGIDKATAIRVGRDVLAEQRTRWALIKADEAARMAELKAWKQFKAQYENPAAPTRTEIKAA
jgi:hypothetical protein